MNRKNLTVYQTGREEPTVPSQNESEKYALNANADNNKQTMTN